MGAQKTNRRCILAALAAASVITAPLGAQNSPAQTPQTQVVPVNPRQGPAAPPSNKPVPGGKATIRSTVSLVEIDVQITNRDGKPVKGLKQEQFTITEDGKAQKVSAFEYNDIEKIDSAGAVDEAPITVPIGSVASSETIKAAARDHRMILLFFDLTSLQPEDLLR
ncbi:MAG TPA: hypothetical protein VK770_08065, partial [Candidatus Acidoferrum sp.]|nr:hypothetical protein [Candidatus Acidoferrum sp.]